VATRTRAGTVTLRPGPGFPAILHSLHTHEQIEDHLCAKSSGICTGVGTVFGPIRFLLDSQYHDGIMNKIEVT